MREINLLPKKPFHEQHFAWLLLLIAAAGCLLLASQYGYGLHQSDAERVGTQQAASLDTQIRDLQKQKVQDQRTRTYWQVSSEADKLRLVRKDWAEDLSFLLVNLPAEAQVAQIALDASATLHAELQFRSLPALLDYLRRLQSYPAFSAVRVTEMSKAGQPELGVQAAKESIRVWLDIRLPMKNYEGVKS